jgi:hypothetical protein
MQDVLSSKLEYFKNITAKGGTQPYQFSLHSGSLPSGLNLSNDGKISGTPTETGKQTFTIQVTDNGHRTESQVFELEIVDPLVITTNQLNDGIVGTPFDQFLSATGGFGDYQWEIYSGTLPDGLTFKNGQISGTPQLFNLWRHCVFCKRHGPFNSFRAGQRFGKKLCYGWQ